MTTAVGEPRKINLRRSGISPWRAFQAKPEDWFDPEEIEKSKRYLKPLRRVGMVQKVLNIAVDVAVIGTHAMPNLLDKLGFNNWVLDVFAVIAATTVIGLALNTGFDWWQSMVYDKKWEFSTMTVKTFWSDFVKGLLLGIVLNALISLLLWVVIRGTDNWWLVGWAVFSVFSVGFAIIYPRVIAPIFNKFEKLPDEELHDGIIAVARSVGADIEKVEIEDASKRDKRDNAYVAGAGKTRRVVIFDTMLSRPKEQITWVSAHEIGHWKLRHILRQIPIALVLLFINFALMKVVLENKDVLEFAGVKSLRDPAAIPLFFFVFGLPTIVTGLLQSYLSRVNEREADLFGLEAVPDPESAAAVMRNLHTDALADLTPSLWKRLNRSHPPVCERLAMFEEWGRRNATS